MAEQQSSNGVRNDCEVPQNVFNNGSTKEPITYQPVRHHWFFNQEIAGKCIWEPFTNKDSRNLEAAHISVAGNSSTDKLVPTDGGRYDVNITTKQRSPVYWQGPTSEVRRCSWFHKGNADGRYTPYEEHVATKLEEELKIAWESNQWHRKVELMNGDTVVFHDRNVLVLFPQTSAAETWSNSQSQPKPRIVKRGVDEFNIEDGEPERVDHLLFLVHGIGSVCDLKFRTVEEVVDDFRSITLQLVQSHYRSSCNKGIANRIEVLPISWHSQLHSEATGIDKKLKSIMLESIAKLREWGHDTILDVLFYTSPRYCQTIVSTVAGELNRIYNLFAKRNPTFKGKVSLGGHSLGSLILFDLLCHQQNQEDEFADDDDGDILVPLKPHPKDRRMSRRISYMMAKVGIGQPQLHYPNLEFQPSAFFALGSPIGMFVTIRGLDSLGEQFRLPTCPAFFNIFHPYDPIAYRMEALVNPLLSPVKPVLIPHHKGRKRMHLELKETVVRVGSDIKNRVIESMKSTLNSFYHFTNFNGSARPAVEEKLEDETPKGAEEPEIEVQITDLSLGVLNKGRRIDYVLQEGPLEFFNEYIFALTSHVCYWESEDTILFILKEIYATMGIEVDNQIPQQTMTIERPSGRAASHCFENNPLIEEMDS